MKELFKKANEQLQKIKNYIIAHEDMFDDINLKLYDACYYQWKEMENDYPLCYKHDQDSYPDSYFNRFCESSYSDFENWCDEEAIIFNKLRHQIGRTSSFCLYNHDIVQWEYNCINWKWTMQECMNIGCEYSFSERIKFNDDGMIDEEMTMYFNENFWTPEEWIEVIREPLEYIIEDLYNDFMKDIEDVIKVYEYIKDFKENQVAYFKEYLDWNEAVLQEEKDEYDAEMRKRAEIIAKMPEELHLMMETAFLNSEDLETILKYLKADITKGVSNKNL